MRRRRLSLKGVRRRLHPAPSHAGRAAASAKRTARKPSPVAVAAAAFARGSCLRSQRPHCRGAAAAGGQDSRRWRRRRWRPLVLCGGGSHERSRRRRRSRRQRRRGGRRGGGRGNGGLGAGGAGAAGARGPELGDRRRALQAGSEQQSDGGNDGGRSGDGLVERYVDSGRALCADARSRVTAVAAPSRTTAGLFPAGLRGTSNRAAAALPRPARRRGGEGGGGDETARRSARVCPTVLVEHELVARPLPGEYLEYPGEIYDERRRRRGVRSACRGIRAQTRLLPASRSPRRRGQAPPRARRLTRRGEEGGRGRGREGRAAWEGEPAPPRERCGALAGLGVRGA